LCSLYRWLAACGIAEPSAAATPYERVLPGAAEPQDEWQVPNLPDRLERVNAADTARGT